MQAYACQLLSAASRNAVIPRSLSIKVDNPLCKYAAFTQGSGDKDGNGSNEVVLYTITKLPYIEKLPPCTTWIFLDRYNRMLVLLIFFLSLSCSTDFSSSHLFILRNKNFQDCLIPLCFLFVYKLSSSDQKIISHSTEIRE